MQVPAWVLFEVCFFLMSLPGPSLADKFRFSKSVSCTNKNPYLLGLSPYHSYRDQFVPIALEAELGRGKYAYGYLSGFCSTQMKTVCKEGRLVSEFDGEEAESAKVGIEYCLKQCICKDIVVNREDAFRRDLRQRLEIKWKNQHISQWIDEGIAQLLEEERGGRTGRRERTRLKEKEALERRRSGAGLSGGDN